MSGFDVQMRSDQMVQQNRLGWGQIEAQARGNSANMMAEGGMRIGGMIQQQRQFDAQQQMQAAQVQQQAQQFMLDNEIERQAAASDIALRQQQMQESVYKLEAMKALDAAGMSKEQLRSMQLQNNAAELQLAEAKKKMATQDEDRVQNMHQSFLKNAGVEGLFAAGLDVNVDESGRLSFSKFKNDTERDARIKAYREARTRVSNPYSRNPDVTRNGILTEKAKIRKEMEYVSYDTSLTPQQRDVKLAQLQDNLDELDNLYDDSLGGRAGGQQGGGTPKPQPKPQLSKEDQDFADTVSARIMQSSVKLMASGGQQANLPADRIGQFMAVNRTKLRAAFNNKNQRYANLDDDTFWSEISNAIADPSHENHKALMMYLEAAAQRGEF